MAILNRLVVRVGLASVLLLITLGLGWPLIEPFLIYWPYKTQDATVQLTNIQDTALRKRVTVTMIPSGLGVFLQGWFVASHSGCSTILYAHGNSGNMADRWAVMQPFVQRGLGFFMFDYRGYGQSKGIPSEKGLYEDLNVASHFLKDKYKILPSHQIAMGASLGGAVVAKVATQNQFQAVVIYSSFTSLIDLAAFHLGRVYLRPILFFIQPFHRQHFNSLAVISNIKTPILFAHRKHDDLIPSDMTVHLYRKAKAPYKRLILEPGQGHAVQSQTLLKGLEDLFKQSGSKLCN